ncbi:TRAP transporter substrate-binding protein DctP [Sporosarcina sp. OR05]|uniref:TRAP transporter substrate-binding protein DctP n=1 Tax=Sporosarcina sp. OR05 TaxID=2969819 RepID=UPI00352A0C8C
MKRAFLIKGYLLIAALVLVLAGCTNSSGKNDESVSADSGKVTLDISLSLAEGSFADVGVQKFKEELQRLSDGEIDLKVYYNNTFGGEREVIEMMGISSLDMATTSSGALGTWTKEFNMFDLPYLFKDHDHAYRVFDSEIGKDLADKFENSANVKILSYWTAGYRYLSNSVRPVKSVEDVAGMKQRVQENQVQIDTWKAYGANPTPMGWTEVFTGLQQGVIDSQSNPLDSINTMKFYEVQKYVSKLPELYQPYLLMMGKPAFDALSTEHQEIVLQAAANSVEHAREGFEKLDEEATEILKGKGMEILETDEIDVESFKKKTESVYEKWAPEFGVDFIEKVRNF